MWGIFEDSRPPLERSCEDKEHTPMQPQPIRRGMLKRADTTVTANQLRHLVPAVWKRSETLPSSATQIPNLVLSNGTKSWVRVQPLTRRPAAFRRGRAEWEPYVSSKPSFSSRTHESVPLEPAGMRWTSSAAAWNGQRADIGPRADRSPASSRGRTEEHCYGRASALDSGSTPFCSINSADVQPGGSWVDEEYWSRWDGWNEIIDWGDETETDKTTKAEGHSVTHSDMSTRGR